MQQEFKIGDTVTLCAWQRQYPDGLNAKVIKVEQHKDGRVFYHIRGDQVVSQCTGQSLKESVLFKPWQISFNLMSEYNLVTNELRSDWLTDNCFVFKFENNDYEIVIRKDSNLVELFNGKGETIETINY